MPDTLKRPRRGSIIFPAAALLLGAVWYTAVSDSSVWSTETDSGYFKPYSHDCGSAADAETGGYMSQWLHP